MMSRRWLVLLGLTATVVAAQTPEPKPFLHPLFADNAVLQRDRAFPVWGWTTPGAVVTVSMSGKSAKATTGADGKWLCRLGPLTAGGPFELKVDGPQQVTLKNLLVGDVWICSGQSNMEMGMGAIGAPQDVAAANNPKIRLFMVNNHTAFKPEETLTADWKVCTPDTILQGGWNGFSAVGYFFGKALCDKLNVPIGLIDSNWGGTIAEAWISAESLKAVPEFVPAIAQVQEMAAKAGTIDRDKAMREWWAKNDPGSTDGPGWADPALATTADWKQSEQPAEWTKMGLGDFDGIGWYRKELDLPAGWAGKEAVLSLGAIDDMDTTWVNGVPVGGLNEWNQPRVYKVPAGTLKEGRNVIAIRVLDTGGGGGLVGDAAAVKLESAGQTTISLAGEWLFRQGKAMGQLPPVPARLDQGNPNIVDVLYNGMIAPLVPLAVKGAIWYQGESNAGRGEQYSRLMPTLVKDWRLRFQNPDLGFYIVQLANFMQTQPQPGESAWAEIREAQALTAFAGEHTGLGLAIDIGDAGDIHPKNKQDVGKRLALAALARTYGQKVEYSGPVYKSLTRRNNSLVLAFDHVGGGLVVKGDKLQGFAVKGADGKWAWADAVVDGATVVVASALVPQPVAVRYAWADNPICNLYNKEGLPAVPFRSDSPYKWPNRPQPAAADEPRTPAVK